MNSVLDPVIATVAAAVVGITGPAAAIPPPEKAPAVCVYSSSTQPAADAEADELAAKIRALVAELNTAADSSDPRPARVTEMLERLDWKDGAHCGSMGDDKPAPAPRTTGLAATIISALSAIGLMDAPLVSQEDEDDEKDDGGDEDKENDKKDDGDDQDKENDKKDDGDDQDKENDKKKDPPALPAPPTDDPPAFEPAPDPDSPAAAVERLIRDLASTLKASSDPAMRKLADDLLDLLNDGGRSKPGRPGGGGGGTTSVLPSGAPELFTDDFEGGDLSQWGTCQAAGVNGDCAGLTVADGMGVGEDPERGMVAQFRVEDGKTAEVGGERSEVRDDNNPGTLVKEGDDRWYSWSMKFPEDFPEPDGGWYLVLQWHQSADSGSPPLGIDISKGTIDIGGDGSDGPRQTIGPIRRGEWVDYVLHAGFSADNGFVEAWEDGKQTVEKTPRTTMTDEANYLKMGIYRDEGATGDAEVWIDDFAIHDGAGAGSGGSNPRPSDPPSSDEKDDGRNQDKKNDEKESDPADKLVATHPQSSPPPDRDVETESVWHALGTGMASNVSGVALMPVDFADPARSGPSPVMAVIARDNKEPDENRISIVSLVPDREPVITPLEWSGDPPVDIEAIDAVPGHPGEYVTLTSAGAGHRITIDDGATATVISTFQVPGGGEKYEGLALATLGGKDIAVWADRGQKDQPGTLFAAPVDLATMTFESPTSLEFIAADLPADARDVSDVEISPEGDLLISAAWEEGDDGPFDGALYNAGTVASTTEGVTLTPAADTAQLMALDGQKVEALACGPDSCVLGADNENDGGALRVIDAASLCAINDPRRHEPTTT